MTVGVTVGVRVGVAEARAVAVAVRVGNVVGVVVGVVVAVLDGVGVGVSVVVAVLDGVGVGVSVVVGGRVGGESDAPRAPGLPFRISSMANAVSISTITTMGAMRDGCSGSGARLKSLMMCRL